jgi:SSS family solute:Na+ symporter
MLAGAVAMLAVLMSKAGGPAAAIAAAGSGYAAATQGKSPSWLSVGSLIFMTSFGTWGLPQMVQKFLRDQGRAGHQEGRRDHGRLRTRDRRHRLHDGAMSHVFFTPESVPRLASGGVNYDLIVRRCLPSICPTPSSPS